MSSPTVFENGTSLDRMPIVTKHEKWWEIVFVANNGKPILKHSSTKLFSLLYTAKTLKYIQLLPTIIEHVYHTQSGAARDQHKHMQYGFMILNSLANKSKTSLKQFI